MCKKREGKTQHNIPGITSNNPVYKSQKFMKEYVITLKCDNSKKKNLHQIGEIYEYLNTGNTSQVTFYLK